MNKNDQFALAMQLENMTEKRKPGRPAVEGSARQVRLAALEQRREENGGYIRLGRPVDPNSPRQMRLAEQQQRAEQNGGAARRGRPVSQDSVRQQRLAAREALIASGEQIKLGRPALPSIEG
jgi:hypothetical protein